MGTGRRLICGRGMELCLMDGLDEGVEVDAEGPSGLGFARFSTAKPSI